VVGHPPSRDAEDPLSQLERVFRGPRCGQGVGERVLHDVLGVAIGEPLAREQDERATQIVVAQPQLPHGRFGGWDLANHVERTSVRAMEV
jgi:hypothetical protein